MIFNFRKIASALASTAMVGSTVALAAAASFPAPFVDGGAADVAVVYGSQLDLGAVTEVTSALSGALATQAGGSASVGSEVFDLYGSTKLYLNDTINSQRTTATNSDMPITLKKESFSGDVTADITHTLKAGSVPRVVYSKQPTSDDDPIFNVELSTSATKPLYNASLTFSKGVELSHADSEGESIRFFGGDYVISSETSGTDLILFRSAQTLFLSSDGTPSSVVEVGGNTYTVELVTASDTSATVRLTDSTGASDTKEINEAASKKILGVEVSVNLADENTATNSISAEVIVGAEKVKMTDGSEILLGANEDAVSGTRVDFLPNGNTTALTGIDIQVTADDSDEDGIVQGGAFVDPIFKTFQFVFEDLGADDDREDIKIKNSGNDKMLLDMTDYRGNAKSINWVYNASSSLTLIADHVRSGIYIADTSGDPWHLGEMQQVNKSHYVILGNEEDGRLLEVVTINNATTGFDSDKVTLKDVFSGENHDVSLTSEGVGTVSIGGNSYTVNYYGSSTLDSNNRWVRINDPDSSGNNMNLFNTISSKNNAKVALYQPTRISNLTSWDGASNILAGIRIPDGDGYTTITVTNNSYEPDSSWNFTFGSTTRTINTSGGGHSAGTLTIGQLTYEVNASGTANHSVDIYLRQPGGSEIRDPALVIFEEKDQANTYEALVVRLEGVGTDADGLGVASAGIDRTSFTSTGYGPSSYTTHESDTDISSVADRWGSVVTIDASESDQRIATISYPKDQVWADLKFASLGEGATTTLGNVRVMDDELETSGMSTKNLIAVGGSCVNTLASSLLNDAGCGPSWTAATGAAANEWIVQTFTNPWAASKVATLVAGWETGDTTNAASYLTTQDGVTTDVGAKWKGSTATAATLVSSGTTAAA